jgi:pimeloyl-ACP methyl ester carboxylesterase
LIKRVPAFSLFVYCSFMIPTSILRVWFLGLLSFLLIGAGIYSGHEWYRRAWSYDFDHQRSYFDPHLGFNHPTLLLAVAAALLLWALAGGLLVRALFSVLKTKGGSGGKPPRRHDRQGAVASRLGRPDGSELQVECYGPEDAPAIILTHGWGADRTEWDYLKAALADRFRLIVWDLPGLGRSTQPANQDYRLENLAGDLQAVLGLAGDRPAVLLGHSIGGMITLTFCGLFPQELGTRVAGIALVQTTYTNPVRTTTLAGLLTALERPVLVPLLHLTMGLAPLVWLMNQLSYLNGSAHLSTITSGFVGTQTWDQVEHLTRLGVNAWPAVLARGMFGMLRYDATATLKTIPVPALVIAGDRDPVCKPEASDRMRQDIAGSQRAVLNPAKHMGLIEHHKRFAEVVSQFARACLQPKPPTSPEVVNPLRADGRGLSPKGTATRPPTT